MSRRKHYLLLTLLFSPCLSKEENDLRCDVTGPGGPKVGVPCVFPFKYDSNTYDACTAVADPAGKPWCSTSVDKRGNHVGGKENWGYCEPGCKTKDEHDSSSGKWLPNPTKLECGSSLSIGYILGGRQASRGEFPFVALLGYRPYSPSSNRTLYLCGGSLINRRYVLTAAHCHDRRRHSAGRVREVVLGEFDVSRDPDCDDGGCLPASRFEIGEADVIVHGGWNPRDPVAGYDVALVRLPIAVDTVEEDAAQMVLPVCLPWRGEAVPTIQLVVVGWGKTSNEEDQVRSPRALEKDHHRTLQKLTVRRVSTQECEKSYGLSLDSSYICAGGIEGQDSCGGDSGGPLVARDGNENVMFLSGIVSFGKTECGLAGVPGVYLDIAKHLDWIKKNLKD